MLQATAIVACRVPAQARRMHRPLLYSDPIGQIRATLSKSGASGSGSNRGRQSMRAAIVAVAMAVLLSACGGGREETAARVCESAVRNKLAGRTFELDVKSMARKAKAESGDILSLNGEIVFDKGLTSEYKQTLDCKVRFEGDKEPSVILLQFNWSMDDVKKN
jgi:hypothetical protein